MSRPVRAVIHTQSLQHNLQRVRDLAPNTKIMAVIKADAYGHGITDVAKTLSFANAFAVASIDEAVVVDDILEVKKPVCLLEGVFEQQELEEASNRQFRLVVHNPAQVEMLENITVDNPFSVWLKIDTGMNRLGFAPADFKAVYQRLQQAESVAEVSLMSHLACADDSNSVMTAAQKALFDDTTEGVLTNRSLANSAGIVQWPDTRYEWVRPGIMLYGSSPILKRTADELDLKPAMTLSSRLMQVQAVRQGQSVGYGAAWTAEKDTLIGVVACGYGDGYPRHAAIGTHVLVNNQRVPLVGRVSMDMITVDLGSQAKAKIGDPVVLWGEGLPVDEVAAGAGTIAYELLCQVTRRVPRILD